MTCAGLVEVLATFFVDGVVILCAVSTFGAGRGGSAFGLLSSIGVAGVSASRVGVNLATTDAGGVGVKAVVENNGAGCLASWKKSAFIGTPIAVKAQMPISIA